MNRQLPALDLVPGTAGGCAGVRVSDPAELGLALDAARLGDVTTLIEVITDQNAFPPITFYTAEA